MLKIKGYKPSKRCAIYIKKMISRGFWKVNEKISTIEKISDKLGISQITTRKVIKQFERQGILRNWGPLGFYLISNSSDVIKINSKNAQYVNFLKTNLNAFDLLHTGAIKIRNWVIKYIKEDKKIIGLNEITGLIVRTDLDELLNMSDSVLTLDHILGIKDTSLFIKEKKKFDRQRELFPIVKLVTKYKKDLHIDE